VRTIAGPDYVRFALGRALDGATRAGDVVASKAGDRRGKAADVAEALSLDDDERDEARHS